MESYTTIIRFFQTGGPFMYPIAIVLVCGLAIALERWLFLTRAKLSNRMAYTKLMPLLKKKDLAAVKHQADLSKAPVAHIISAGLVRMKQSPRREDAEYAMEEGVMEYMPRLEKRTPYIATLANISTLLGLLGTIIGLIAAFTAVANADPAEKATLLSASISVAMNTTAFGLMAAIPLLLIHSVLQTKTTEIVDSLEMVGVKVLNILGDPSASTTATPRTRATDTPKAA